MPEATSIGQAGLEAVLESQPFSRGQAGEGHKRERPQRYGAVLYSHFGGLEEPAVERLEEGRWIVVADVRARRGAGDGTGGKWADDTVRLIGAAQEMQQGCDEQRCAR